MKRIVFILVFTVMLGVNNMFAFAADATKEKLDKILPPGSAQQGGQSLPSSDLATGIVPQAIKILLALTGTVSFIVFVYAGIMLIIAQGNEEEITKFKNILLWSVVGLVFIGAAYALVSGVLQISFT